MSFISYAQNFEDALLNRVFGGQATGFYVDIGAGHPTDGSVTRAFYERGWSGINLEPGPWFDALAADRPRDINLKMAVLDYKGVSPFVVEPSNPGESHVPSVSAEGTPSVPCDTLEAIVREHARNRPIDFLKIDAEGSELAIIRSTDWRTLRPGLLLVEATLPWSNILSNEEWEPLLLAGGYRRMYFDGINCLYAPEEDAGSLARFFAVPVNCLDGQSYQSSVPPLLVERDALAHGLQQHQHLLEAANARLEELARAHEAARSEAADRLDSERETLAAAKAQIVKMEAEHAAGLDDGKAKLELERSIRHEVEVAHAGLKGEHVGFRDAVASELERERAESRAARDFFALSAADHAASIQRMTAELEREKAEVRTASAEIVRLNAEHADLRMAAAIELERERGAHQAAKTEVVRLTSEAVALRDGASVDLERERAAVQALEARLARQEAEHAKARDAAAADLAREKAVLVEIRIEMARSSAEYAAVRRELEAKGAEVERLREALDKATRSEGEFALSQRNQGYLEQSYDAMTRRNSRLAAENAALRKGRHADATEAGGERGPEALVYSEVASALDRVRNLPSEVDEFRRLPPDSVIAADMLASLASELERTLVTLALENVAGLRAEGPAS